MYSIAKSVGIFGMPPWIIALVFNYYSKRKSHGWRQDLCDNELQPYSPITPEANKFVRLVDTASTVPISFNPGLVVHDSFFAPDELGVLARFAKELTGELGLPIPQNGKVSFAKFLHRANFPAKPSAASGYNEATSPVPAAGTCDVAMTDFDEAELVKKYSGVLEQIRYVSDHCEDEHPCRAKWGSGDALKLSKLPLPLRALNHKVRDKLPHLGQFRHAYIEYSASGEFIRTPKPQRGFDGHEFVIIPFFGDDGAVLTFTPTKRDLEPDSARAMNRAWTTADLDVYVPPGSLLQVRSKARFKYGWAVRPGLPWFGNPRNVLPLNKDLMSLSPRRSNEIVEYGGRPTPSALREARDKNIEKPSSDIGSSSTCGSNWLTSWIPFLSASMSTSSSSSSSTNLQDGSAFTEHDKATRPHFAAKWWGPAAASITTSLATATAGAKQHKSQDPEGKQSSLSPTGGARGVLVMCYEGPVSEKKQRNRRILIELEAYGIAPEPGQDGSFAWAPAIAPSAEEVQKEGFFKWMIRNYPALLTNHAL